VIEASNSEEVVAVLDDAAFVIDIILCDAQLRGTMNGFELRSRMKESRPQLQVVLAGSIESAANAAANICDEGPHLRRPYDPQGIVDYLRRLTKGAMD